MQRSLTGRQHARLSIGNGAVHSRAGEWVASTHQQLFHFHVAICGSLAASLAADVVVASAGRVGYLPVRSVRSSSRTHPTFPAIIIPLRTAPVERDRSGGGYDAGGAAGGRARSDGGGRRHASSGAADSKPQLSDAVRPYVPRRRGNPNPHARGHGEGSISRPVVSAD